MSTTSGNQGLDALADAIAERVIEHMQAQTGSRLFDVRAAAKYIGRSEQALRRLAAKGAVPAVRRDGRVFLDREDLDQWIEMGKG